MEYNGFPVVSESFFIQTVWKNWQTGRIEGDVMGCFTARSTWILICSSDTMEQDAYKKLLFHQSNPALPNLRLKYLSRQ